MLGGPETVWSGRFPGRHRLFVSCLIFLVEEAAQGLGGGGGSGHLGPARDWSRRERPGP